MKTLFITGTDTDIGKTTVSVALLNGFKSLGLKTACMKPIASGCQKNQAGQWQNNDALMLQQATTCKQDYYQINPIAFEPPIAPHIAAEKAGVALTVNQLSSLIKTHLNPSADVHLIEGAGGWFVPINTQETTADLIAQLNIPVICVVGIRLGCLNHALLTCEAIKNRGIPFLGWIANCLNPLTDIDQKNIDTLKKMIEAPCLGIMPHININNPISERLVINIHSLPHYDNETLKQYYR